MWPFTSFCGVVIKYVIVLNVHHTYKKKNSYVEVYHLLTDLIFSYLNVLLNGVKIYQPRNLWYIFLKEFLHKFTLSCKQRRGINHGISLLPRVRKLNTNSVPFIFLPNQCEIQEKIRTALLRILTWSISKWQILVMMFIHQMLACSKRRDLNM